MFVLHGTEYTMRSSAKDHTRHRRARPRSGARHLALLPLVIGVAIGMAQAAAKPAGLDWIDLIPPSARSQQSVVQGSIAHEDAAALQAATDSLGNAPLRNDLDGQEVRIAGYFVPLAFRGPKVVEFLIVPFAGACIHVPPPPANQIVHVTYKQGVDLARLSVSVYVTGKIAAKPIVTQVATVGYRIDATLVENAN